MLILQTDDLVRARSRLAALGVRTVFEAEYPDISAVHLHPKDIGGAIVSIDEPRPATAWRWGGPGWRLQPGARAGQRVVGVQVEAHDPPAMAARWAQVLGLAAPLAAAEGWRLDLRGAWVDFVPAGERGEGIAGWTLAVADRAAVLQAARSLGLPVQGDAITLLGTRVALRGG
jgi:hypothetical protein